jgi:hypothetical protein
MAPKYLSAEGVRDNASREATDGNGSTFFYILRLSTMLDFPTSRQGIRLILSTERPYQRSEFARGSSSTSAV